MTTRDVFAEALALATADEQAAFLNEFAHCLKAACRTSQTRGWDMQTFYIAERLTPTAAALMRELADTYTHLDAEANEPVLRRKCEELATLEAAIKARQQEIAQSPF